MYLTCPTPPMTQEAQYTVSPHKLFIIGQPGPPQPSTQRETAQRLRLGSGRAGQLARAAGSCLALGGLDYFCCSGNSFYDFIH
eukprot:9154084-Lingulodinium_polyedra.AAC.1